MPHSSDFENYKGLNPGESIRLGLTNDQRKIIKDKIGADAEYVIISNMGERQTKEEGQFVNIQGHLADDSVID